MVRFAVAGAVLLFLAFAARVTGEPVAVRSPEVSAQMTGAFQFERAG